MTNLFKNQTRQYILNQKFPNLALPFIVVDRLIILEKRKTRKILGKTRYKINKNKSLCSFK